MSVLGHQRRIHDVRDESAMPPIATELCTTASDVSSSKATITLAIAGAKISDGPRAKVIAGRLKKLEFLPICIVLHSRSERGLHAPDRLPALPARYDRLRS